MPAVNEQGNLFAWARTRRETPSKGAERRDSAHSGIQAHKPEKRAPTPKRKLRRRGFSEYLAEPNRWRAEIAKRTRRGKRGCRIWFAATNRGGSPQASWLGRTISVRRLLWALDNRAEPVGNIQASCGNPRCLTGQHLVLTGGHTRRNAAKPIAAPEPKPKPAPRLARCPRGGCGGALLPDRDDGGLYKCASCSRAFKARGGQG